MERKFKIIGLYLGMLFFISILLILITSLSNRKFSPTYSGIENLEQQSVSFDSTYQESVTKLTQNNESLNNIVKEQNVKISELEKELIEKDKIIKEYETKFNSDAENLYKALSSYLNDNKEETKIIVKSINRENMNPENQTVYDNLLNKLQ